MDMNSVREMMETMGLSVPNSADKLMNDIEHQQKQVVLFCWKSLKKKESYICYL